MSDRLYEWGEDPYMNLGSTSDFAVMPRYYNTTDYEGFVWPHGVWNGTAVQNIYPFTRISATSNGNNAYILYTTDNVSIPEQYGLSLTGLEFGSSQRSLKRLVMPPVTGEIFFDPVAVSLPNGSLLAMWNSIPFGEMSKATNPFAISEVIAEYSCYDPQSGSWSSVKSLATRGVALSESLSSGPAGCCALVLEGDSIFSSNRYLMEYDLDNASELLSIGIANVSKIVSFNAFSQIAVLEHVDGSYEVLNLSSRTPIAMPSINGYRIGIVQLATNSADALGILYSNSTSNIFCIYNVSAQTTSFSMTIPQTPNHIVFAECARERSEYRLITADASGIESYFIAGQNVRTPHSYPMQNITSMGATIMNNSILVYTTENYGNSTYPLLNLTLTSIPDVLGDITGPNRLLDGKVDILDIFVIARAFSCKPGDYYWNRAADLDENGIVDILDVFVVARQFGKTA
jgi:hypothetical protein